MLLLWTDSLKNGADMEVIILTKDYK